MLKKLHIQNIALIDELDIEFGNGLNVLTGETGAGKSIIVGSFNFILGGKFDRNLIRTGSDFARVDAVFNVKSEAQRQEITNISGVSAGDEVIMSRTLKINGSGECRINGAITSAQILRDAASVLISIHGQTDTEILLKPKTHANFLDTYGGKTLIDIRDKYLKAVQQLREISSKLNTFGGTDTERKRMLDMYEFQIKEIENAKLKPEEEQQLLERRTQMQNFEKLTAAYRRAISAFHEGGIETGFKELSAAISQIETIDPKNANTIAERIRAAKIEVDDIVGELRSQHSGLEFNESELKEVTERLEEYKNLKRKYGATVQDILKFLEKTRANYESLTMGEFAMKKINEEIIAQKKIVETTASELVGARHHAADDMTPKLVTHLRDLGMPHAQFEITDIGVDNVTFLFSANQGVAPKPLYSIISGGEMSRFALALKVVLSGKSDGITLVFDEIDSGVSGIMGHKIAEKMLAISKHNQIICVTHLAQIASQGHHHFHIAKNEANGTTKTSMRKLEGTEAKIEIERMLGGADFVKKVSGAFPPEPPPTYAR